MKYYFLLPLCLVCLLSFGQEIDNTTDTFEIEDFQETDSIEIYKVKRLSFGIKLGIPNVAGLSLEGITPLLGNRIAPFVDFSSFPVNTVETDIDLKYSEFGSNFYFGKEGKGVYVGIGFGTLKPEITFKDQEFEEDGNRGTRNSSCFNGNKNHQPEIGDKNWRAYILPSRTRLWDWYHPNNG